MDILKMYFRAVGSIIFMVFALIIVCSIIIIDNTISKRARNLRRRKRFKI